ncbi:MAG TPA: hypothetical protein PKW08_11730 [Flavobacteriaceae bacterium]|nr:hypothetical protein [Flavobacteriaceae bacterium]MCB9213201.1 hypothetical protein [Alteromonas sp.]HPF10127.1 hypothetical protein [Flavobacteriaceae bacterium]HQU22248.1 hypothetical protein [Flavobacteriaceae bacterium]HQU66129.1 hypothetical protein [Flavobacteriaceae bacterium]
MKKELLALILLFSTTALWSQLETNNNTVKFENNDTYTPSDTGLELPPRKIPSLTIPRDDKDPQEKTTLGEDEKDSFSISTDDGLLENTYDKAPKAFTQDTEPLPEYAKDQFLGDVTTNATYVTIQYRDHEYVDGDLIRVYVNGDIVQSSVFLGGSFSGFTLTLEQGVNTIEFEALNQGSSGPNTAELHVYDDKGLIISAKKWNLLTGKRATIVVNKD